MRLYPGGYFAIESDSQRVDSHHPKLAEALNGLDLRPFAVGEVVDLHDSVARMLIAEGWAEVAAVNVPATADDRPPRRRRVRKPELN